MNNSYNNIHKVIASEAVVSQVTPYHYCLLFWARWNGWVWSINLKTFSEGLKCCSRNWVSESRCRMTETTFIQLLLITLVSNGFGKQFFLAYVVFTFSSVFVSEPWLYITDWCTINLQVFLSLAIVIQWDNVIPVQAAILSLQHLLGLPRFLLPFNLSLERVGVSSPGDHFAN